MAEHVHLHNHSHFSLLDGHGLPKEMAEEVARQGGRALALTEHGNMHSAYAHQKACEAAGVQPIFGIEAYVAPVTISREDKRRVFYSEGNHDQDREEGKDVSGGGAYTHMTLLARSNEGLKNLFNITSDSFEKGFYRKPRTDTEFLSEFSNGLIATTGCPSGEIQTRLRLGQFDQAVQYAAKMQDIFGRENYFVELMNHDMGINLEREAIPRLLELSKKLNIPLIATNDSHYTRREDAAKHEHMLCMQTGSNMSERTYEQGGKRFAFSGDGYYLKSAEEMLALFPEDQFPGALSNTVRIAEMSEGVKMEFDPGLRPKIPLPEGETAASYLRKITFKGLEDRYGRRLNNEEVDRLEYELRIIEDKGFSDYYLVTQEFINWAKDNGVIVGPARGSGGGSLVAFAIAITELDPLRHGLLFERFLNPERDSPPDFDTDFDDRTRDTVIQHVYDTYGNDRVASIATYGTLGVKSGLKDSARILNVPYSVGDQLTKKVPEAIMGKEMTFKDLTDPESARYHEAEDFRAIVEELDAQEVIDVARGVEGRLKSTGVHAAGVIISSERLTDHIPLMTRQKDGLTITQWDYPTCEALGLIKMDFLGLRNLTIIGDALEDVERNHGVKITTNELIHGTLDDKKTFDLLARGDTVGVFQLDGSGMQELMRRVVPTEFKDIAAVSALYRPGPMGMNAHNDYADRKNGRKPVIYPHPSLEEALTPILGRTYGVCVYQEQVMKIAQELAGYSLAEADNLRRAMGKKKRDVLEIEFARFSSGMKEKGYEQEAVQAIWDVLMPFADYGFNESHAVGYGLLSYITAFLKANYPAEYMSALLTSVFTADVEKVQGYLQECRIMGIEVKVPDVNESEWRCAATDAKTLRFGLAGIRGVSQTVSNMIVEARGDDQFVSLNDFLHRIPAAAARKTVLQALVDAGAFDGFGHTRRALGVVIPEAAASANQVKKAASLGQDSLFAGLGEDNPDTQEITIPNISEFPKKEMLSKEREVLGLYVSDHPLSGMTEALQGNRSNSISDFTSGRVEPVIGFPPRDGKRQRIAVLVSGVMRKQSKAGKHFAILSIEDESGQMEATLFGSTYEEYADMLEVDKVLVLTGAARVQEAGEHPSFNVDKVSELEVTSSGRFPVNFRLTMEQCTPESIEAVKHVLRRHSGTSPVRLHLRQPDNTIAVLEVEEGLWVKPSPLLTREVQELFGVNAVGRWR